MNHKNKKKDLEFDIRKSQIKKIYSLLEVSEPRLLFDTYLIKDQHLVTSKVKDYRDRSLVTVQIKNILESINSKKLLRGEHIERRLMLWLWYHHAISYAVWYYKDSLLARKYAALALKYQPKGHKNKITRLLSLLVNGRVSEADGWLKKIKEKQERTTAAKLIRFYKEGGFVFKK